MRRVPSKCFILTLLCVLPLFVLFPAPSAYGLRPLLDLITESLPGDTHVEAFMRCPIANYLDAVCVILSKEEKVQRRGHSFFISSYFVIYNLENGKLVKLFQYSSEYTEKTPPRNITQIDSRTIMVTWESQKYVAFTIFREIGNKIELVMDGIGDDLPELVLNKRGGNPEVFVTDSDRRLTEIFEFQGNKYTKTGEVPFEQRFKALK